MTLSGRGSFDVTTKGNGSTSNAPRIPKKTPTKQSNGGTTSQSRTQKININDDHPGVGNQDFAS